ncbi:MAG: ribonuclease H family protein [Lachnospiraceae bacterium]|nr:ribonuclease H family protein [Lachnospiraceae bacterium]
MAKTKFYAVKVGSVPGIYTSWAEAEPLVKGFPNAKYKSFSTREEAETFMENVSVSSTSNTVKKVASTTSSNEDYSLPYAFVDGSFNPVTKVYGCGGFLYDLNGNRHLIQAHDNDPEMASMRNVAGEILGSTLAIKKALELGLTNLTIYYDYEGIKHWAEKTWKRNKEGTASYSDFVSSISNKISLHFVHVKAHTGIPGNEEADTLAKESVGIL